MSKPFTPNVELFVDVLARIERDPDHWNQGSWLEFVKVQNGRVDICATAGCFAGWACLIKGEGYPMLFTNQLLRAAEGRPTSTSLWMRPSNKETEIDYYAQELLGISDVYDYDITGEEEEAITELFDAGNDLDKLYEYSATICRLDESELRQRVQAKAAQLAEVNIKALPRPVDENGELINVAT